MYELNFDELKILIRIVQDKIKKLELLRDIEPTDYVERAIKDYESIRSKLVHQRVEFPYPKHGI